MAVPVPAELSLLLSLGDVRAAIVLHSPSFDALGLWFCICVLGDVCWLVSIYDWTMMDYIAIPGFGLERGADADALVRRGNVRWEAGKCLWIL